LCSRHSYPRRRPLPRRICAPFVGSSGTHIAAFPWHLKNSALRPRPLDRTGRAGLGFAEHGR
jgi:hypothetical protein